MKKIKKIFLNTQELKLTFFFVDRTLYFEDQGDFIINFELPRYHLITLLLIYVISFFSYNFLLISLFAFSVIIFNNN
ncbi:hypothetical protein A3SI_19456 [Nitritalea halalkaliphila LW7]|uniref:Uncharacterized protein n=1 Tax=Nitritalea halalkaliphila LW7 TaxID=1189621 RepID=I5BSN6_9BACT|nr:hypothetical protein A3SI_19456 [Nitritalea halalkaliphila LW7]